MCFGWAVSCLVRDIVHKVRHLYLTCLTDVVVCDRICIALCLTLLDETVESPPVVQAFLAWSPSFLCSSLACIDGPVHHADGFHGAVPDSTERKSLEVTPCIWYTWFVTHRHNSFVLQIIIGLWIYTFFTSIEPFTNSKTMKTFGTKCKQMLLNATLQFNLSNFIRRLSVSVPLIATAQSFKKKSVNTETDDQYNGTPRLKVKQLSF